MISDAIKILGSFVVLKSGIVSPNSSSEKMAETSIMMLTYYKNNLIHIFINDAEIAAAGSAINGNLHLGINEDILWEKTRFLKDILN